MKEKKNVSKLNGMMNKKSYEARNVSKLNGMRQGYLCEDPEVC